VIEAVTSFESESDSALYYWDNNLKDSIARGIFLSDFDLFNSKIAKVLP